MPTSSKCILSLLSVVITGCAGSALYDEPDPMQPAMPIAFAGVGDTAATSRGYATTAANMDEFAVSATVYDTQGNRSLYFAHEKYRFQYLGQDVYRTITGAVHYWLSDKDEYNFFAYTPSPYIYFQPGVVDKFIYTTPKDVLKHPDIVVATCIAADYGKPVPLEFTHPLAQVSISEGALMRYGRIISITFRGIIDHGEYNMLTGEWTMLGADTDSFTWTCNVPTEPYADLSGEYFNFFFVPQPLGTDAAIVVAFEDAAGVTEIHTARLSGTWHGGHHYRYTISLP